MFTDDICSDKRFYFGVRKSTHQSEKKNIIQVRAVNPKRCERIQDVFSNSISEKSVQDKRCIETAVPLHTRIVNASGELVACNFLHSYGRNCSDNEL